MIETMDCWAIKNSQALEDLRVGKNEFKDFRPKFLMGLK